MPEEKLIAEQLELKESLANQYPWMSETQVEEAVSLILEQLARHIEAGGKLGFFYQAKDDENAHFVLLEIVPKKDANSQTNSANEVGK